MGLYKLLVHQKAFSGEDLLINPKHFSNLKKGDIVQIYHPEDEFSRLLLQITTFKEDLQGKEAISIEQSIALTFQLRTYHDVKVEQVVASTVTLDSVEITFKDQYLGRSDMWRLKNSMMDTCVYLNKKIEFCGGVVRCQVYEMWAQGERVACGVVSEDTKIVFRSSTSMVYLFIQMSSEMWEFDIYGDLYFEKSVNGFLADLFQKWKKHGSNHEVTIVLFSRTFYEASALEDFPESMQECLQKDYKGRYYEDFYRVAVQNEKYDDWSNVLNSLHRLFLDYKKTVLEHHLYSIPDVKIPCAYNSNAAQGNFLEVLNMSLNVFDKHYLDRSFDRTGQLSVVITPGVGVFEVDRELTNVTKQRIIDNGVGSDLVCVGEQPLHAVPLLKFHNKDTIIAADDYSMPHWINLSFYSNKSPSIYTHFTPRIKVPSIYHRENNDAETSSDSDDETFLNNVYDQDAHDSHVFTLPSAQPNQLSNSILRYARGSDGKIIRRKTSDPHIEYASKPNNPFQNLSPYSLNRTDSSPETAHFMDGGINFSDNIDISEVDSPPCRALVGSAGTSSPILSSHKFSVFIRPVRALINPFDPSHVTVKLTSNRRRWTHIFPKGPTGVLIQQHHYPDGQLLPLIDQEIDVSETDSPFFLQSAKNSYSSFNKNIDHHRTSKKSQILLWGATGEQEWTPDLTTGVDWKSLTIPACLPITTDYFPDSFYLRNDYLFSEHDLIPDAVNADVVNFQQRPTCKKPLTTEQVFQELISQRLAQGFQLVVKNDSQNRDQSSSVVAPKKGSKDIKEYILSIGRIFHRIKLSGSKITVTRYVPRHPYPTFQVHYRYRFQAPDHATYGVSWVSFNTEKLESYKWNYLDHYICMRGDSDFPLFDNQYKFWRFRMYLLPLNSPATKKILEGSNHCDIYSMITIEEQKLLAEGVCRFVETWVNRLKRINNKRRLDLASQNSALSLTRRRHSTGIVYVTQKQKQTMVGSSPFRERLGSNRLPDKCRPRSGSKILERGRVSPATDAFVPLTVTVDGDDNDDTFTLNDQPALNVSSSLLEILEAMKHPQFGINFITPVYSIPPNTFTSHDAVKWLTNCMQGSVTENEIISIFEKCVSKNMICHASGDTSMPFVVGFYMYYIVPQEKDEEYQPLCDTQSFESQWLEVKVEKLQAPPVIPFCLAEFPPPPFCLVNPSSKWQMPLYKNSHLEMDISNKSDRVEWGHIRYQSSYRPDRAFELIVQWVASSGPIVADMIFNWARKAQTCGFQLVPIPADPLALPYSLQSDPLRGPVFIPIDIESLIENNKNLFADFNAKSWNQRLVLFQEAIAVKFGFMTCTVETESMAHHHNQYIHVTGNCFLMIPVSDLCENSPVIAAQSRTYSYLSQNRMQKIMRYPVGPVESVGKSRQEYITRHVTSSTQDYFDKKVGFLWSWNHMISRQRKWCPAPATADESFQDKLLDDFRKFCCNHENRLKLFWQECLELKKKEYVLFT